MSISKEKIEYLGHMISFKGVEPDKNKIKALFNSAFPTFVKQQRGFLGLTGFCRRL